MPTFKTVEVHPPTGSPNAPWCVDAGEDAFARSARSVCELYSAGLQPAQIKTRTSSLRLIFEQDNTRTDVLVAVLTEPLGGFELARVTLPKGVELLDEPARARLVLDVVHGATLRLAEARGWAKSALEAAKEHALRERLQYKWIGPAKASPDRRHTARPIYRLQDDGFGRVVLEVRRRADNTLVTRTEEALAFTTSEGFARSARTLRWHGSGTVELTPYCPFFGEDSGLVRVSLADADVDTDAAASADASPMPDDPAQAALPMATVPAVVVRGEGANAPDAGPQIIWYGECRDDVPRAYTTTLHGLLDAIRGPEWLTWWSAADDDVLQVVYGFDVDKLTTRARRHNNKLSVAIDRPLQTFSAADDPVSLAHQDVEAMLATIRRRTGLGPHPKLPNLAELVAQTTQTIAYENDRMDRMRSLLSVLADRLPAGLVTRLTTDLDDGLTAGFLKVLRIQLLHLVVATTEQERAELDALTHDG